MNVTDFARHRPSSSLSNTPSPTAWPRAPTRNLEGPRENASEIMKENEIMRLRAVDDKEFNRLYSRQLLEDTPLPFPLAGPPPRPRSQPSN